MKKFIQENWFKIIIAISILIVALSIGYYSGLLKPKIKINPLRDAPSLRLNPIYY